MVFNVVAVRLWCVYLWNCCNVDWFGDLEWVSYVFTVGYDLKADVFISNCVGLGAVILGLGCSGTILYAWNFVLLWWWGVSLVILE